MLVANDPEAAGLYELIDLFEQQRALVKVTKRMDTEPGAREQLKKEALYTRTVSVLRETIAKLILASRPRYTCTTKQMTPMIILSSEMFESDKGCRI